MFLHLYNNIGISIDRVINHEGETIELYSSVDCKGIVGNDGRLYILDLLRTFPVDINYVKCKCYTTMSNVSVIQPCQM